MMALDGSPVTGATIASPAGENLTSSTQKKTSESVDNAEVKLNMNSYQMVWVTNKHGLFYKRNSIAKARKVSLANPNICPLDPN